MNSHPVASGRPARSRPSVGRMLLDLLRGAVIGVVEIIPGVSGGTLALVIGVYDTLITSIGEFVRGVVRSVEGLVRRTGQARARAHFARVRWGAMVPLGLGMAVALVVASAVIAPLVEEYPVHTRALFAGLIVASLAVPIRMVGTWGVREVVIALVAAGAGVVLVSLRGAEVSDPSLWLVAAAASLAICALVLPGVSGSFLLLVLGVYAPTLVALNERNFAYIGAFLAGAVAGLAAFVSLLQWLLAHRRVVTLAVMTGLMAGSLRALWPWQTDAGLEAPQGSVGAAVALFVLGLVLVTVLVVMERRLTRARAVAEVAQGTGIDTGVESDATPDVTPGEQA